jgi:hypothetical protein
MTFHVSLIFPTSFQKGRFENIGGGGQMTSVRIDSKTIHSLILAGRSGQLLLREGGEDSPNLRIVSFKHRFDTERKRRREREKEEERKRER